jgi:hypothetical protein
LKVYIILLEKMVVLLSGFFKQPIAVNNIPN